MSTGNWTEVITSKRDLFDLRFGELWKYRDLIKMFVRRDIVSVYKQTVLGPFWFFISPFMTVLLFTFIFSKIAHIDTDGIPAPIFYLTGTTLWNYFQQCFLSSSNTFLANEGIFGKVYFPRLISPISTIISNLIKFFIQILVLIILIAYYVIVEDYDLKLHSTLLLFPFLVFLMAGISLGIGLLTSAATSKYRDLQMFIGFGIGLLMYATPIIYPISQVPENYRALLMLNPIAPIIETFRYSIFGIGEFSFSALAYSSFVMVVVLFSGIVIFNQVEKSFMDTI